MLRETYAHVPYQFECVRAEQITRERNDVKEECNEELSGMNSPTEESAGYPGMLELDVEKYLPYVENFDITEEQKVEYLRTLWSIMSAFVDLGWDVDSVPEFLPALHEISGEQCAENVQVSDGNVSGAFNEFAGRVKQGEDCNK